MSKCIVSVNLFRVARELTISLSNETHNFVSTHYCTALTELELSRLRIHLFPPSNFFFFCESTNHRVPLLGETVLHFIRWWWLIYGERPPLVRLAYQFFARGFLWMSKRKLIIPLVRDCWSLFLFHLLREWLLNGCETGETERVTIWI